MCFKGVFGSEVCLLLFLWFVNVICCSEKYKTDTCSGVIVGGQHVDISLVSKLFVKCTHSSQRRFFHNRFDMFERNTGFLGCRGVDLAYGNQYNSGNCIVLPFFQTCFFVNMIENQNCPSLDLADENMYICEFL